MKNLSLNLNKISVGLCAESYKTPVKESKALNKWRDTPCS